MATKPSVHYLLTLGHFRWRTLRSPTGHRFQCQIGPTNLRNLIPRLSRFHLSHLLGQSRFSYLDRYLIPIRLDLNIRIGQIRSHMRCSVFRPLGRCFPKFNNYPIILLPCTILTLLRHNLLLAPSINFDPPTFRYLFLNRILLVSDGHFLFRNFHHSLRRTLI